MAFPFYFLFLGVLPFSMFVREYIPSISPRAFGICYVALGMLVTFFWSRRLLIKGRSDPSKLRPIRIDFKYNTIWYVDQAKTKRSVLPFGVVGGLGALAWFFLKPYQDSPMMLFVVFGVFPAIFSVFLLPEYPKMLATYFYIREVEREHGQKFVFPDLEEVEEMRSRSRIGRWLNPHLRNRSVEHAR